MMIMSFLTMPSLLFPNDDNIIITHEAWTHFIHGIGLGTATIVVTFLLELCSLDTVRKLLKQPGGGLSLYTTAIVMNLRNHFGYGVPIYTVAATLFCRQQNELDNTERLWIAFVILMVHSIAFYSIHHAFHTYPSLYKHHRFHHRFNVNVPPSAANAVTSVEYILAYMLPFTIAMPWVQPDTIVLRACILLVSIPNLFIHTPFIEELSIKVLPKWWVTTHDHLEHHRKLHTKYAAPTFNVDYFVEQYYDEKSK